MDKLITFSVLEMTDKGETVMIKFQPNMPDGVTWDSPSDPLFVTVNKAENYLAVGDTFGGIVIAKTEEVEEPVV